ncbi:hypothetical protein [Nocardia sp. NPDC052566]|uniref:hypothetical protein n=1 Tax=Nocardia sp. NPDC052566 TaxID=3364330 RepID=UPI0037C5A136
MAGMRITVCLPSREATRVEAAVAAAMAPFEMDFARGEELDIWDTWRVAYVALALEHALPRRNVLSLAGWWCEDGGPGIHGMCHSLADCPHEPDLPAGYDHIADYLAALPGDTLLVNVRCHV